jgi:hypothetical protein
MPRNVARPCVPVRRLFGVLVVRHSVLVVAVVVLEMIVRAAAAARSLGLLAWCRSPGKAQ